MNFYGSRLNFKRSSHVVGRKSVAATASNATRQQRYSRQLDPPASASRDLHSRDDRRYDDSRRDPHDESRGRTRPSSSRAAEYDGGRRQSHARTHAADSPSAADDRRRSSRADPATDQRTERFAEERSRSGRDGHGDRSRREEQRHRDHPKSSPVGKERNATGTESRKGRDGHESSRHDEPRPTTGRRDAEKPRTGTASEKRQSEAHAKDKGGTAGTEQESSKAGAADQPGAGGKQGAAAVKSEILKEKEDTPLAAVPKKLTTEELADFVAKYVYEKAREAVANRGAAVQRSLVVQSVVRFVKTRRETEKREKVRAKHAALTKQKADRIASEKSGDPSSSALKTAHLDLVETFLKPAKPKQKKPPLPDRRAYTPTKKRARKSRFSDIVSNDAEDDTRPDASLAESDEPSSPAGVRPKRRRLTLAHSPGSPDPGQASPDGDRQNSVESIASTELFEKALEKRGKEKNAPTVHKESEIRLQKPEVRHAKTSSLKLSSSLAGEGAIPHLLLSTRPPLSPDGSAHLGSTLTTSEDSASQGPSKPTGITKKTTSKNSKTATKKKRGSRSQSHKKQSENTTDDEQYAGVLLSLNQKFKQSDDAGLTRPVEVVSSGRYYDPNCDDMLIDDGKEAVQSDKERDAQRSDKDKEVPKKEKDKETVKKEKEKPRTSELAKDESVDMDVEPPERVGHCSRSDVYVRAEHMGQHRQRNVHSRTGTSAQSSRECRQENRVYRKGVRKINPKNDIITFNHLKQRRKSVSFGQSLIHGMGLFAKENIEAGEFIIEYVGDLIRRVVADLREKKYVRQGMGDSYLFRLSGDWVIDATRRGGIARYINHSCEPNVMAKIISVVGEPKIVFYSKRSIKEGEELTYDYKFDFEEEDLKIPCLCQAQSCRKYLN